MLVASKSGALSSTRTLYAATRRCNGMRLTATSRPSTHYRHHSSLIVCNAAPPTEESEAPTTSTQVHDTTTQPEGESWAMAMEEELTFNPPSGGQKAMTNFRLFFALPWRRFKSGSALVFKLGGAISELPQGRFSDVANMPAICDSLVKAAYDPRVNGIVFKIDPLGCSWAKVQEIRRHIKMFKQSGKWAVAYMERAGEKEYYMASAFDEIYIPPSASLSLRGVAVSGSFLRGTLEKVGVEPEIKRIGKFKSAGDQLLRKDMSEAQREQLTALLDDIHGTWVSEIAQERGKTEEQVLEMLDAGIYDMEEFKQGGWITDLKYEDEINDLLKERTGGKEDELRAVNYKKYSKVGRSAFGLNGKKVIAVVRTSGAIVGSGGSGSNITAPNVIRQLRALKKNKKIAAVVLRVDSPGGDALASDLMWREIQKLSEEKPVIASMADVAASGGYYMSMAAQKIVAEPLTITGSIGVVTGKFNLQELYHRAGFNKETISRGRYAELLSENRAFTEQEQQLFDQAAEHAYRSFRDKAAQSRGMDIEAMQNVAQGRVWSGKRAATIGLVDAVGGISRAIALAKEAAGLKQEDRVTVLEVSRAQSSPLALLTSRGGASMSGSGLFENPLQFLGMLALSVLGGGNGGSSGLASALGAPAVMQTLGTMAAASSVLGDGEMELMAGLANGQAMAQLPLPQVDGVGSAALKQSVWSGETGSDLFDC